MELNYTVGLHNKFGERVDDGIYIHIDQVAAIRFEDPEEVMAFGERVCKMCNEIVDEWMEPEEDE